GDRRPARTGVRADGDLLRRDWAATVGTVRARATRHRPRGRRRLCAARLRERQDQEHQDEAEHARVPLQAKAFEALDRLPASVNTILLPNESEGQIASRGSDSI